VEFWTKSLRIFNALCDNAKQSIRQLARQTGLSKSSVHRLKHAITRRDHYPESWLWETEDGRRWLTRLVVAALYTFSLKRGVGLETISEFFTHLHLETQVGCSPSALGGVMRALEAAILATTAAWEHAGVATGDMREIIGAVDETFLQRMMLVFMDLVSGYLLFEEVAEDRPYDTWHILVAVRLERLSSGVLSLVSDRAKALIKLAETGLGCLSIPDVFHLIHELVKSYSWAILGRLRHARQALRQAQERLRTCEASHPSGAEAQQAQAVVEASEAEVKRWESVHSAYRQHLETISLLLHPWRLVDSRRQTSAEVERQVHVELRAIEVLVETHGLPGKKKALDKVRKQLVGLCALVDFWWQGVWHDVQHIALTPMWKRWVEELLLPLLYWQQQVARTRCPRRKAKILQALKAIQDEFETHPITQQLAPDIL
jgi:IclR helix-turn-helix domain